jgi:hypothetical protein
MFSFVAMLCNAQQTVILEKINNGKIMSVKLPALVYIKFKNTGYQNLLLEKISGDSFYFKKYYNQPQNYDCPISAISNLKFPKKGDHLSQLAFTFFTATALYITPLTIAGFYHKSTDAGDPTLSMAIVFGIPISVVSIITSASLAKHLPKNFVSKKWKIYVK